MQYGRAWQQQQLQIRSLEINLADTLFALPQIVHILWRPKTLNFRIKRIRFAKLSYFQWNISRQLNSLKSVRCGLVSHKKVRMGFTN